MQPIKGCKLEAIYEGVGGSSGVGSTMRCSDKFKPVVDIYGVYFTAQFPENRKPPRFIRGGQRERRWYLCR